MRDTITSITPPFFVQGAGDGLLSFKVHGPTDAETSLLRHNASLYTGIYTAPEPGCYVIELTFGAEKKHIPGRCRSRFSCQLFSLLMSTIFLSQKMRNPEIGLSQKLSIFFITGSPFSVVVQFPGSVHSEESHHRSEKSGDGTGLLGNVSTVGSSYGEVPSFLDTGYQFAMWDELLV